MAAVYFIPSAWLHNDVLFHPGVPSLLNITLLLPVHILISQTDCIARLSDSH